MIFIGLSMVYIGIFITNFGIHLELDKKITNNTNYNFSVKSLTFADTFRDEKGNIIPPIYYVGADKIEDKK